MTPRRDIKKTKPHKGLVSYINLLGNQLTPAPAADAPAEAEALDCAGIACGFAFAAVSCSGIFLK